MRQTLGRGPGVTLDCGHMAGDFHGDHGTRGERRERKQRKQRRALRLHGGSLRRIYRDAVLKRAQAKQSLSEAPPSKTPPSRAPKRSA